MIFNNPSKYYLFMYLINISVVCITFTFLIEL